MARKQGEDYFDGAIGMTGGVNSDLAPQLLGGDTDHFAVNTTYSGAFPHQRPRQRRIELTFSTPAVEAAFTTPGLFQGCHYYRPDDINRMQEIILALAGRIYRIIPNATTGTATVEDITAAPFSATSKIVWMEQAEKWLVMKDGSLQSPNIYDGTVVFAANTLPNAHPLRPGRQMAYSRGALWQMETDGVHYTMGDYIYSSTGTGDFRDAVLYNTPPGLVDFKFVIPGNFGIAMAMNTSAVLDASMGQGPVHITAQWAIFSVTPPVGAKSGWSSANNFPNPVATVSLIQQGGLSQWSTLLMNGDLIFRAFDGIRSLILGRRDFTTWGNTPISSEMNTVMQYDDPALLTVSSAAVFDNRLLMTLSPALDEEHGVYHRGLAVMNNEVLSSLRGKSPSIYDGLWTGPDILQIMHGIFANVDRCFMMVLNRVDVDHPKVEIWEQTDEDGDDQIGTNLIPIFWVRETGAFFKDSLLDLKRLINGYLWVDNLFGNVHFRVLYKPDNHPCWIPWAEWDECANNSECEQPNISVAAPRVPVPQFRVRMPFGSPPTSATVDGQEVSYCDPVTNRPYRNFYTVQLRFEIRGRCRIVGLKLWAAAEPEPQWGAPKCPSET